MARTNETTNSKIPALPDQPGFRHFGDGIAGEVVAARLQGFDTNTLAYVDVAVDSSGTLQTSSSGGGGGGSVTQGTSPWVVSAASLPLPTGAAKDSTLTDGTLRVGGTTAVSGTFWQSVQPISDNSGSLTVDNNGTFAVQASLAAGSAVIGHVIVDSAPTTAVTGPLTDTQLRASAVPTSLATLPALTAGTAVIGHVIVDTAPTTAVTIASMPSTPVTGTFWQSIQPVSGTVAATQSTTPWVVDPSAVTSPVSVASLPLPSGAATDAKLTTIAAHLSAIRDSVNDLAVAAILNNQKEI